GVARPGARGPVARRARWRGVCRDRSEHARGAAGGPRAAGSRRDGGSAEPRRAGGGLCEAGGGIRRGACPARGRRGSESRRARSRSRTSSTDLTAATSDALLERARKVIPGGVNSPVRAFTGVGGMPRFVRSATGPFLEDVDGNRLLDYVGSWGVMV